MNVSTMLTWDLCFPVFLQSSTSCQEFFLLSFYRHTSCVQRSLPVELRSPADHAYYFLSQRPSATRICWGGRWHPGFVLSCVFFLPLSGSRASLERGGGGPVPKLRTDQNSLAPTQKAPKRRRPRPLFHVVTCKKTQPSRSTAEDKRT